MANLAVTVNTSTIDATAGGRMTDEELVENRAIPRLKTLAKVPDMSLSDIPSHEVIVRLGMLRNIYRIQIMVNKAVHNTGHHTRETLSSEFSWEAGSIFSKEKDLAELVKRAERSTREIDDDEGIGESDEVPGASKAKQQTILDSGFPSETKASIKQPGPTSVYSMATSVSNSDGASRVPVNSQTLTTLVSTSADSGRGKSVSTSIRSRSASSQMRLLVKVRLMQRIELLVRTLLLLASDAKVIDKLKKELFAKRNYLQRRISDLREELQLFTSRQTALFSAKLVDLRERVLSLNAISPNGVFIWVITGVKQRIADAKEGKRTSFYSQPFYVSRYGYKMALRLYLNGDGLGKNAYVSLFVVLEKSPFDAIQRWPFNQKVTIIMYDQFFNEHVIDAFKPDIYNPSFRKPENWMNLASGSSLFLPLCVFERQLSSDINGPPVDYFRTDTLFLKVIVDVSELPLTTAMALTTTASSSSSNENRSEKS